MRIPCVRCLLREMDEQTALQQVLDFQRSVPKMEQADPSQYETRLAVCKACKWLNKGTCRKCGAYVKREPFGQMHIARWGQTCGVVKLGHYITYH